MISKNPFKKGMTVKFAVYSPKGATRGKGTIVKLPPRKQPVNGMNRLSVRDGSGKIWRPFVTQCKAA